MLENNFDTLVFIPSTVMSDYITFSMSVIHTAKKSPRIACMQDKIFAVKSAKENSFFLFIFHLLCIVWISNLLSSLNSIKFAKS